MISDVVYTGRGMTRQTRQQTDVSFYLWHFDKVQEICKALFVTSSVDSLKLWVYFNFNFFAY